MPEEVQHEQPSSGPESRKEKGSCKKGGAKAWLQGIQEVSINEIAWSGLDTNGSGVMACILMVLEPAS